MEELPVMEHFFTIQGEGYHTGRAAYFIRLAGCDVGCHWCDVKESWEADKHPKVLNNDLIATARASNANFVVITGGEPTMHNLEKLTTQLHTNHFEIAIETSGAHPIVGNFDWVCLSPKKFKAPLEENFLLADELKVVVFHPSDIQWAEEMARKVKSTCKLYLQPEWDRREKISTVIIDYVKKNPQWKISLQTHKFLNIP